MKNDEAIQLVSRLAACIKRIRLDQGLSHETLAERSGLSRQAISMIERGTRVPSILSCMKVSKGLGTSLQKLLDQAEKPKARK